MDSPLVEELTKAVVTAENKRIIARKAGMDLVEIEFYITRRDAFLEVIEIVKKHEKELTVV